MVSLYSLFVLWCSKTRATHTQKGPALGSLRGLGQCPMEGRHQVANWGQICSGPEDEGLWVLQLRWLRPGKGGRDTLQLNANAAKSSGTSGVRAVPPGLARSPGRKRGLEPSGCSLHPCYLCFPKRHTEQWKSDEIKCSGAESGIVITIEQKWGLRGSCDPQPAVFWCPPPTSLFSLLRSSHEWELLRGKGLDRVCVLIDRSLWLIYNFQYLDAAFRGALWSPHCLFIPVASQERQQWSSLRTWKCVSAQPSSPSLNPGPGASWWTVRIVGIWDARGALFNHQISRSFFKIWVCPHKGWMCEPHSSCVLWEVGK